MVRLEFTSLGLFGMCTSKCCVSDVRGLIWSYQKKKRICWNWPIRGKKNLIYQLQVYSSDHHKYHYQVGPGSSLCLCLCSVLCCSCLSHGAVWWIINTSPSRTANCDITSFFYWLLPIGFRDGWKHSVVNVLTENVWLSDACCYYSFRWLKCTG